MDLFYRVKGFLERYSIFLILLSAFLIRFTGLNYGLPFLYDPDEPFLVDPAIDILTTGDLNPHWFDWPGSFVIYLLAILFAIILGTYFLYSSILGYVHSLSDFKELVKSNPIFYFRHNPTLYYFSGRLVMVFFAIITIYVVYLIAKKLFDKPTGTLAAFCLAISPLHIGFSRTIRADIPTTMLVMLSTYFLLRSLNQNRNAKSLMLSSLFAGFSIAAKYTSGIIISPILIHCLITDSKQTKLLTTKYFVDSAKIKTNLSRALLSIFIGFFIFAPFVILDWRQSIGDMIYMARPTHLGHERLPGMQNHIWYLTNPLQKGIGGLFFEIFAVLGLCLILSKKSYKETLFLAFPILFFLIIGCGRLRWSHWMMPVLPFEAILFGVGFYSSYNYLIRRKVFQGLRLKIFFLFAIVIILASFPAVTSEIKQAIKLSRLDTRTIAKDWIEKNLPSGSKIAYEYYAPHLHVNPKGSLTLMNFGWERIVCEPLSFYINQSVDYIIITSAFKERCYNEPEKYSKEISRYEALKTEAELIKVFDIKENPGPVIEIYRLKYTD